MQIAVVSDSVDQGAEPRIRISDTFPGNAGAS